MKKTLLTLISIFVFSTFTNAQFVQIPSGTSSDINSIGYKNGRLFFLGENYLCSTDDLGTNLNQLNIPTNISFNYGLNVLDSSNLFIISRSQNSSNLYQILHSINGGINWSVIFETIGNPIHDLCVSENGHLLAVGNFGNIYTSLDESNWTVSDISYSTTISKCISLSDSSFFIGGFEYAGYSDDFGTTWNTNYFNQSHVSSIIPISSDTIYMSSYFWNGWESFFSKSIDRGNSWSTISMGSEIGIFDMVFENSLKGFAVGAKYNYPDTIGIIMQTTDGGETWSTITSDYNSEFLSVDKIENYLFITGTNGIILRTDLSILNIPEFNAGTKQEISISPNPATQKINITIPTESDFQEHGFLLDASGRTIKTFNLTGTKTEIDIADLLSGVYFVRIGNAVEKISVE